MVRNAHDDELVMSLVEMALGKPAPERRDYISSACGEDTELQEVVWRYVRSEETMDGFLLAPLCPPLEIENPFEQGELLEGRFRIERELARGGMGIVYEGYDETLKRRIALKCARAGFRKRLSPEVRHASDISHPNICKIYELHTAATRRGEVDFLTMEFVDGETLAEKVKRGPMAEDVARKIALQICDGLEEAHRKQVVHGDLKSGNVIIAAGPDGGVRAVITDFGLAQRPEGGPWPIVVGGTPDYMAPELWKGAKSSVATDIYALGVLLRELAYGHEGEAPARGGSKWDAVIARCMEEEPGRRFASASDVASALAPRTRRWAMAAVAAVLVAGLSGATAYRVATGPSETVRLAVAPFEPAGVYEETQKRVAGLKGSAKTRMVAMPRVEGATHVLRVALRPDGEALLLKAELRDARNGVNTSEWSAKYEKAEMKHVPQALAGMVTGAFHLPALEATVNPAAKQDYENGLLYLRKNSTVDSAMPLLERAVEKDPDSALTHAALAEGYGWKYRVSNDHAWVQRSDSALRAAERRNQDLAEVRQVAGLHHAREGRLEQAIASLLRSIELEPGRSDAYRWLGIAYLRSNEHEKALVALFRAVEVEPHYNRNIVELGNYYYWRADYREAVKHFKKAVESAPLEPTTHFALGTAYWRQGLYADAEREMHVSLDLGETPQSLSNLGVYLIYQGRDQEAIPYFTRALKWWPDRYMLWMSLGTVYRRLNLANDAERSYRRGLELAEVEVAKNPRAGYVRACVAYICAWLGDRRRAETEIAQALRLASGDANTLGMAVKTYEALGRRQESLAVLSGTPLEMRADLGRYPDLADLHRDSRFQRMLAENVGK